MRWKGGIRERREKKDSVEINKGEGNLKNEEEGRKKEREGVGKKNKEGKNEN